MNMYMQRLFEDSVGFAGLVIIRRCVGIADGPEFRIKDVKKRLSAESKCLAFGEKLLSEKHWKGGIKEFVKVLREYV